MSDVNKFMDRFSRDNGYYDGRTILGLGSYVTIQDGTYNAVWMIAGFNIEHNQTAADGTVYDNGYGICMIPQINVSAECWHQYSSVPGAYKSSTVHTSTLPTIVNNLKNILGDHIVNRNVLLSSGVNSSVRSNAYTWTTSYATLMSVGQMTGTFASHNNKYDDGEANYKLPLFDHADYKTGYDFWTRGISGGTQFAGAYRVDGEGNIGGYGVWSSLHVRPLIYLR